jgi:hypothetical protein
VPDGLTRYCRLGLHFRPRCGALLLEIFQKRKLDPLLAKDRDLEAISRASRVRIGHTPSIFLVFSLHNSSSHFSANALRASGGRGRIRFPRTTYWLSEFNRSGIFTSIGVMSAVVDVISAGMDIVLSAVDRVV